jgi:hypothetical protein
MARPKVYPRFKSDSGEEYLQLIDANVLRDLDTSWIVDEFAVQTAIRLFNEYANAAAVWFFVETGIELLVHNTPEGMIWAVPDERQFSQKYGWLKTKAERAFSKVVERINKDGKEITDKYRMRLQNESQT